GTLSRVGTEGESAARWTGPTACRGRQKPARQTFRSVSAWLETTRTHPGAQARPKGLQFCRAVAGRGTAFARSTERHTIASDSDPRPGLGSVSSRPGPVAGALAALLLLAATGGRAAARSLAIERFDAEVVVARNPNIDVTETIRARFTGAWNGLYRTVPVVYRTPQGFDYRLFLRPLAVTDGAGRPLRYEASSERHYRKFKIWIPDAQDAARTVIFRYRVANALRFFTDHDELYWNVTGDEWDVPIEAASAVIRLPTGAADVRSLAFTGSYGSRAQDADVRTVSDGVDIDMHRPLAFHEGLTAVVGWSKGAVEEPGTLARALLFLRANAVFTVPLAVFALMLRLWYTRGRDPRLRPIVPRYEPPDGLSPAETGTLVDNRADLRDVTSTLVDLAVRGGRPGRQGGGRHPRRYAGHRLLCRGALRRSRLRLRLGDAGTHRGGRPGSRGRARLRGVPRPGGERPHRPRGEDPRDVREV